MVFGHNTNIKIGEFLFHVQTEDRGEAHGLIDTTVYYRGRVLHRRTNNYYDLFPLNEDSQKVLKLRLDEQHLAVLEEMRSGALQFSVPQASSETVQQKSERASAAATPKLIVELANPTSWVSGKRANLRVSVKRQDGQPASGARVSAEIEGSAEAHTYQSMTGAEGQTQIEFEMPRITRGDAALVIRAEAGESRGQLRFSLRAKPRVPSL